MKPKKRNFSDKLDKISIGQPKTDFNTIFSFKKEGTSGLENAFLIDISLIAPNPNQPRKVFLKKSLKELSASIKERGILQPIRVRPKNEKYEIIAGERRWQAAKMAGLKEIACIVSDQDDKETCIDALMENIHREDLNAIDRANALDELRANLGLQSWEKVGEKLGLTRQHIYNLLGLKTLPIDVQKDIQSGSLTEKHGRALKPLVKKEDELKKVYEKIKNEKLSGDEALTLSKQVRQIKETKSFIKLKNSTEKYKEILIKTDFKELSKEEAELIKRLISELQIIISNKKVK